jgi:hypothetical protein
MEMTFPSASSNPSVTMDLTRRMEMSFADNLATVQSSPFRGTVEELGRYTTQTFNVKVVKLGLKTV